MTFNEWRDTYSPHPLMNEAMAEAAWNAASAWKDIETKSLLNEVERLRDALAQPEPDNWNEVEALKTEIHRYKDTLQDVRGHYERACAERDALKFAQPQQEPAKDHK
jgi:hypothetical protein